MEGTRKFVRGVYQLDWGMHWEKQGLLLGFKLALVGGIGGKKVFPLQRLKEG